MLENLKIARGILSAQTGALSQLISRIDFISSVIENTENDAETAEMLTLKMIDPMATRFNEELKVIITNLNEVFLS